MYDSTTCLPSDHRPIEADVILCLPDNGHRIPRGKNMPSEGYPTGNHFIDKYRQISYFIALEIKCRAKKQGVSYRTAWRWF